MTATALFSVVRRHRSRPVSRKRLGLALLMAASVAAPLTHQSTARAIVCSSDPILIVNGAEVDVVSTLTTDPSNVSELDYQVTVPSGALLGQLRLTLGLGFPEHVTYVFSPNEPWGTVTVAASVVTQSGVAPFPVSVKVSSLLAGSNTSSGTSDATMTVSLDNILML